MSTPTYSTSLNDEQIKKVLEAIIENLEKMGLLKGLSTQDKKQLVDSTAQELKNAGADLTLGNVQTKEMQNKLAVAVVATYTNSFEKKEENKFKIAPLFDNNKSLDEEKALGNDIKLLQDKFNKLEPKMQNPRDEKAHKEEHKEEKENKQQPSPRGPKLRAVVITDDAGNIIEITSELTLSKKEAALTESEIKGAGLTGAIEELKQHRLDHDSINQELYSAGISTSPRPEYK